MTLRGFMELLRLSVRRERREFVLSSVGVAIGVGSLVFFVALGLGVGKVVREDVFPADAQLLDVVAPSVTLGGLFGAARLTQETVDRLAALPGVARVHRKMTVRVPAVTRYDGDFFGARLRMGFEVIALGVDPGLLSRDVDEAAFVDPGPAQPIPAVAASRLVELYNKTFAPARGLPQLSGAMLKGFTFPIELNRSFVAQVAPGQTAREQLVVVGLSDRALLSGVTIPLGAARRLNRAFGADDETFTAVTLEAQDPSVVPRLAEAAKQMGLSIDDQERRLSESAGAAVALTTSAMGLLSGLICLVAAVSIARGLSASVRARAKELGIMRAVGATRGDIRRLVFGEAALIGLAGAGFGVLAAVLGALAVDAAAARYFPEFPFKPASFFRFPLWLFGAALGVGVLAALIGAYMPGRQAADLDPARSLAG